MLADSQRLLQVFINLLGNARDACDNAGEVHIRASKSGDQVQIDVEDNGSGIPQALQAQVFEPFFTTKDPGVGTGLGLALVFSIMDDMNGKVHLTSPVSQDAQCGTRVTLSLSSACYGPGYEM